MNFGGAISLSSGDIELAVQVGISRFLRSLLISLESVIKETFRIVALHFGQISGSTSNTRLRRDAQDLEAFLIDFGAKAQGIIVVVDSASELSIDFFFCTDLYQS